MLIWHCRVGTVSHVMFSCSERRAHSVLLEAFVVALGWSALKKKNYKLHCPSKVKPLEVRFLANVSALGLKN